VTLDEDLAWEVSELVPIASIDDLIRP
jgi:hypothetical protein